MKHSKLQNHFAQIEKDIIRLKNWNNKLSNNIQLIDAVIALPIPMLINN